MKAPALILIAALAALSGSAQSPATEPPAATVICYHVVESPYDTDFSITRQKFAQQMQYLATTGYNVISLDDLYDYVSGRRKSLPRNAVVLTFDDGYRCVFTEVYPLLKSYRFPFTVFIYPKWIGQSAYALTWSQIREMSEDGVDVQSHSLSHSFLTRRRGNYARVSDYSSWLKTELVESKRQIERHTGRSVRYLAYPYGDYDPFVAEAVEKAGYDAALTCDFGPVRRSSDPLRLRRIVIRKDTTLASFRKLLGSEPLNLQAVEPLAGGRFDADAPVVSAKIANFSSLDPASVQLAVLSLGRTPFSYDPRNGTISLVVRDELKGKTQRAFVWGTDKKSGKRVEATWTFFATPPSVANDQEPRPEQAAALASSGEKRSVVEQRKR